MEPLRDTELSPLDPTHSVPAPFDRVKSRYTGIFVEGQEDDLRPLTPGEHHPLHNSHWESERPPFLKTVAIQGFALLWLAPIGTLLYLNWKPHIIGASAWCPFGHCLPRVWDPYISKNEATAYELPAKFDRETHNLLGALQLVAKALEVWFIVIAGWLVYICTTILAGRRQGIPIGYFNRPTEFAEVAGLFDPLLWFTLRRLPSVRDRSRKGRKRVYLFVVTTIFLCFVCNLMGPAVAVLLIPSLQWVQTGAMEHHVYVESGAIEPPNAQGYLFADSQCYESSTDPEEDRIQKNRLTAMFYAHNYSCSWPWSQNLDAWMDSYYAVAPQSYQSAIVSNSIISVQNATSFTFNMTSLPISSNKSAGLDDAASVVWVPSRGVLTNMSNDISMVAYISYGEGSSEMRDEYGLSQAEFDSYAECNNTVQTFLHRDGPILGSVVNAWLGVNNETHWTTMVDEDKWLKCYEGYDITNAPLAWTQGTEGMVSAKYTKCISIGTGWADGYKNASFSISGLYSESLKAYQPELSVFIHSSGKAAFLPEGRLPERVAVECLVKNRRVSDGALCDWDAFWRTGDDPKVRYRSKAVTTIEMLSSDNTLYNDAAQNPDYNRTDYPYNTTLVIDFVAYETFADYMLDPSRLTNSLYTTDYADNLSKTATLDDIKPVMVDPAWVLAAWTADSGAQMLVDDATARVYLLNAFAMILHENSDRATDPVLAQWSRIDAIGMMPIIQMLSMIDFNTTAVAPDAASDAQYPKLARFARIQVYAYGISSRTGWLGVVVTGVGCVVVLLEVVLGFIDRRRLRSLTQLLVAALEHQYTDEFRGVHDEKTISRVPFRLRHDTRNAGRFKFEKVG
ncbi:hypothetical protein CLAFUW4_11003 [Fulvia fulva]|uniref:Uncharacterized protein n=1 Tax=Passalora fulva TaxID=5499 RepID=A0A9Q8PC76_PASFU|nr:uncharacterized protein CLAFUR5_10046 [Fulvia fulva]KAK4619344.1 hypothetical protein CLAFUR4_11008 [Fulvia fulva]KAK4620981.1 hypothetical protein CLAFUR0_11015 [Fulvia fulva]UJO19774.1 hypothetical protein CLAFUR5_10046 [Fulvia fulva]WPV17541.1 hypothetical protein CLAFUW4_11003 [Fulvia fulva]WPV32522.1 hypothetical protein CLAFUW7_11001 [Fulvia fulva]